ncbi:MAG: phosphate signaling complex protein PhoU [Chitinophagales bacterium]|nr:phosphate signaling complex protein PhoU [Chitinophagales bacterium]
MPNEELTTRKTTHLDAELDRLKGQIEEMGTLVQNQLKKSILAITKLNKEIAREVIFQERRVNAEELKIDRDCENIMALFNPVAIDLRLVFASFKINSHLERIGDNAKGIARYAVQIEQPYDAKLLENLRIMKMYEIADAMISDNLLAFAKSNALLARNIFSKDELMDEINKSADQVIADYLKYHPEEVVNALHIASVIHKLERIGDLNKNIAEEIIFFVEANVLKHEKEKI